MTSLFFTCEIGVAGWQKSLRELTAGAEKSYSPSILPFSFPQSMLSHIRISVLVLTGNEYSLLFHKLLKMAGTFSGVELPEILVLRQLARDQLILHLESGRDLLIKKIM